MLHNFQYKYSSIDGWFDFGKLYLHILNSFESGIFVEVGAWLGKSTAFMAELIKVTNKNIKFFSIDTWEGTPNEIEHTNYIQSIGGVDNLYKSFLSNMANSNILEFIIPIKLSSIEASYLFKDNTLSFVFLDAGHSYNDIKSDIIAWKPKIKSGGYIGGHDYNLNHEPSAGIVQAVHEEFNAIDIRGASWLVQL